MGFWSSLFGSSDEEDPTQEEVEEDEETVREYFENNPDKQWWRTAYGNDKEPSDYWPDEVEEQPKGFWGRLFG